MRKLYPEVADEFDYFFNPKDLPEKDAWKLHSPQGHNFSDFKPINLDICHTCRTLTHQCHSKSQTYKSVVRRLVQDFNQRQKRQETLECLERSMHKRRSQSAKSSPKRSPTRSQRGNKKSPK